LACLHRPLRHCWRGFAGLLHPAADPGVRCVSPRHSGDSGTPHWPSLVGVQPVTRIPRPRSAFHTLQRIPPTRSRAVSPRPLPPWCSLPSQPRSLRRFRCRLRRARLDCVRQHLRGVAPQMSPYRHPPFPASIRPILSGLWPPSRSFDRGIAPVADASRTLCASIPARRNPCSFAAALVVRPGARPEVKELRSVPPPLLRRSRSNRSVGDPSAGHGGEGFVATPYDVVTAMKQVPRWHCYLREGASLGIFQAPSTLGSSDAGTFRCPCSDSVRIRRAHLAMHTRGCRWRPFGLRGPRPTFNTGWVTRVNWMVERSDLIPLELAFEHRFSRCTTMVCHRWG